MDKLTLIIFIPKKSASYLALFLCSIFIYMKQKLKILLTYLKPIKKPISVTWFVYDAEPDWFALLISDNLTVPQNILNIIIEIAENNWDDVLDNVYTDLNNYQYILTIDPINNEIRLNCLVEEDVDSDDYSTYQIDDDVFLKYMKDNNITEITCGYNGSGDDGSINDIIVKEPPILYLNIEGLNLIDDIDD